jgi:hypothetical protein
LGHCEKGDHCEEVGSEVSIWTKLKMRCSLSSIGNTIHPAVVASMAIFPPIMVNPIIKAKNITHKDVRCALGSRPRLNLRSKSDRGNNSMTNNQTRVYIFDTIDRLAPELA